MKFKKHRILTLVLSIVMTVSLFMTSAQATGFTAMIAQGNTTDVGDCKAVFSWLKQVPNGNTYTIYNEGWLYNNGNSYAVTTRATAQNLIDAGSRDVLYWSGHGASNPLRLNVNATVTGGTYSTINIPSTLQVNTSNWANTCVWNKNTNLKAVFFAACSVLDNTYDECKYLARAMKASNVRVIAGYHMTSPTHPTDTNIANSFFSNAANNGVSGGESIRSAWQTANELNNASANWAVLCFKENYNQYYRVPGFPGNTYTAPSSTAAVYRFWSNYKDPTGGQPMATLSASGNSNLPLELRIVDSISADYSSLKGKLQSAKDSELFVARELDDSANMTSNVLDADALQRIAEVYINSAFKNNIPLLNTIKTVGTISCEEIDEDTGVVPNSETVVGKTFCYSNQYNGIRIEDNFVKVGTDMSGIYFVANKWKSIEAAGQRTLQDINMLTLAEAVQAALGSQNNTSVISHEMVYAPTNGDIYRLCYKLVLSDGTTTYIDCESGVAY